ncbi:hypothetical protein BJ546DRAFT_1059598 [Cryomyces antarcticus]
MGISSQRTTATYPPKKKQRPSKSERAARPERDNARLGCIAYPPQGDATSIQQRVLGRYHTSIVKELKDKAPGQVFDAVIITAGYFAKESLDEPNFDSEVLMYKNSSIEPVFIVHHLQKANLLKEGSKIILVSSESGSITLRHESEGGGNPDIMRVRQHLIWIHADGDDESVGFDKFWDAGGAVTLDAAAVSLSAFIESFDMRKTGQYWAPRGPGDIGAVEDVLGPKSELPTPLQLPR